MRRQTILICLPIMFFGFFPTPCARAGRNPGAMRLFHKAEVSFHKANELINTDRRAAGIYFLKALVFFKALRDRKGIENSQLLFNIGNCYFRIGDLGRAVLNYRRAERLSPEDPCILENLALARVACNAGPSGNQPGVENFLAPGRQGPRTALFQRIPSWRSSNAPIRTWFFPIASALFWTCLSLYLTRRKLWVRHILVLSALTLLVSAFALAIDLRSFYLQTDGVVVSETPARKGNSTAFSSDLPELLVPGTEFEVVEKRPGWYLIKTGNGECGWIPRESAELIKRVDR